MIFQGQDERRGLWVRPRFLFIQICTGLMVDLGHMPVLMRPEQSGDADFLWTKKFGSAVHIKGPFGVKFASQSQFQ